MKLSPESYFQAVRQWDSKHRIVGRTPIETLIKESEESLRSFLSEGSRPDTLIDVGAGAGIMGLPWLWMRENSKAIMVEPDKKKSAFLRDLVANKMPELMSRVLILPSRIEDVSRETVLSFSGTSFFCVARAFSGEKTLAESFAASELKGDPLYIFEGGVTPNKKFMLRQV